MYADAVLTADLWRAACRHTDLAQSLPEFMRILALRTPVDQAVLFELAGDLCTRIAAVPDHADGDRPWSIRGRAVTELTGWVARGGLVLINTQRTGRSALRPLVPALPPGHVVCGALRRGDVPEGVIAWRVAPGTEIDDRVTHLLADALEPLAAAMDTARRFNELESHRRAAEADRQSALTRLGRLSLADPIIGTDAGLRAVIERVERVAQSDVPVLILGETGSGKEVIARAIHERSSRADGPFLRVNCGAIPPDLVDSHLFGHEKGAFTGAIERRQGWFERAHMGTLLLDEVGELSPAAQVRLLRVLQEGTFERVGSQHTTHVDVRVLAATHRDLTDMVRRHIFREDLWYRIAVFPLIIPPLRDRPEDLPLLARHFADRAAVRLGLPTLELTPDDIRHLAGYDWPGNLRELAAVIDRAALLGPPGRLALGPAMGLALPTSRDRRRDARPGGTAPGEISTFDDAARQHIEAALRSTRGRIEGPGGAAEILAVNPHTLRSRMRRLGIDWRCHRT